MTKACLFNLNNGVETDVFYASFEVLKFFVFFNLKYIPQKDTPSPLGGWLLASANY